MRHLLFFFNTRTGLASHSGKNTSIMKPAARSRAISSPTILLFSSDSRRRGCLTGFASARTCSLCSAKSFGTPGMSFGDHAKMSRFSRRKSTSSPSYLLSRFAPMTANLSGFSGSRGIFFFPWPAGRSLEHHIPWGQGTGPAACRPWPRLGPASSFLQQSRETLPAGCWLQHTRRISCSLRLW